MNYTGVFKRQTTIILLSILVIAILLIGTAMAMFTDTKTSETQTLTAGTLSATFEGSTALNTELTPMTDDEATMASNNTYTFTLQNTGSLPMNYTITIFNDTSVHGEALDHKYIKVAYDNGGGQYLSQLGKVNGSATDQNQITYILKSDSINANSGSEQHTIRIWISDKDDSGAETDTDIIGKVIKLKIGLSGTVKETE